MLKVTNDAKVKIQNLIQVNAQKKELKQNELYLRIFIKGSGPQGLQHGMALTTEKRDDDFVFEDNGVQILVDRMSQQYLVGAEIDYISLELGSNFKISNPNQVAAAGCGTCSGDAGCC